ncbi:MAG: histidine phosphatase family protein [Bacteroidetes bacterium]|nr:MAG: histidine phosphatase family protein [Bacteroidota bacterium]
MKTLYLMRHAKSDWDASYDGDHERPLSKRGIKAARRIGKFLSGIGETPSLVLCSSAVRTRETLQNASVEGEWSDVPVSIENDLYLTSRENVMERLRTLSNDVDSVMVLGHEPTTSALAGILIGNASVRVPTAACLRIDLYVEDWVDIRPQCGVLEWHVTPKILKRQTS